MKIINFLIESLETFFIQTNEHKPLVIGFILLELLSLTTSIMAMIYQNKLKKNNIWKEVIKHLQILGIILFGNIIDKFIIQQGSSTSNILILYYIGDLSIRILDNSTILGVPVPERVYSLIKKISNNTSK